MACGSAQLTADLLTGRQPAIRHDDLAWQRYAGAGRLPMSQRPGAQPKAA
jgi:D-amino-acid dehydrogenase